MSQFLLSAGFLQFSPVLSCILPDTGWIAYLALLWLSHFQFCPSNFWLVLHSPQLGLELQASRVSGLHFLSNLLSNLTSYQIFTDNIDILCPKSDLPPLVIKLPGFKVLLLHPGKTIKPTKLVR